MLKEANQRGQLQTVSINLVLFLLSKLFHPQNKEDKRFKSMAPFSFSGSSKSMIWKRNMHDQWKSIIRRIMSISNSDLVRRVVQGGHVRF